MARAGKKKSKNAAKTRIAGASRKPPAKTALKTPPKTAAKKGGKSKSGNLNPEKSRTSPNTAKPDPYDALIDAAVAVLALTIDPAWKAAVRANLQVIFAQAALFADVALPDDAEPAPIFRA
jgi:hypothetical protein